MTTATVDSPATGLRKFLGYDNLDLSRVVSSNLISAHTLLVIRTVISLHLSAVFIATLYVSARDDVFYMVPTTFTNLSNMGLTAYYLVMSIYWGMLFDPNNTMDTLNQYVDYSHHGVDLACLLLEMVFNRMELPWVCILGPISMVILYMFLAWVYFAA
ncbi:hypothetical protein BGZ79_004397 [Entomortierella chlamydospora]|nr:hypothetical protein BGZ79_004397 [Entomortierella chlamydospora]